VKCLATGGRYSGELSVFSRPAGMGGKFRRNHGDNAALNREKRGRKLVSGRNRDKSGAPPTGLNFF
jgi:hypothetical protein